MVWEQVSSNRWERPLDGLEGYFNVVAGITAGLCDGREHYTELAKIKLEINLPDVEAALKHAWKQIRFKQPHIATFTDGMKIVYEVPDTKGLEEWLALTFIMSSALDADNLYQSVKPIKQATLYYLPRTSELVLRAYHYTIDGIGILIFWHSYLSALSSPKKDIVFKDEVARLAPCLEEVFDFPVTPSEETLNKAMETFMSWAGSIPGIDPISQLRSAASGQYYNTEVVFSAKTSNTLIRAYKAKGITVTAAVYAAYIRAVMKYADPASKVSQYVTAMQFDLRHYLPEPFNSSRYGVSIYYTPWPYKINLPTSYMDISKSLHEYYQAMFKNNANIMEKLEIKGHFMRLLYGAVQIPEFLAKPISKDALVSSLGVVERYMQREYGEIKVTDFKIGVDVVNGMSMLFFYTFQDQLHLVYSFNDGFEKATDIDRYLGEMENILVKELLL
jgi:hypothetical protein